MSKMMKSLAGMKLSTRAKNVLTNLVVYGGGVETWDDVVDHYKRDPTEVEVRLLRTPGAGRLTVNEILAELKARAKGYDKTNEVLWLAESRVDEMKTTLDKLSRGEPADLVDLDVLASLRRALNARTIHTRVP